MRCEIDSGHDGSHRAKCAGAPLLHGDLTRLGRFYGTGKAYDHHRYTPLYAGHLKHRRHDPMCILEIGIGGYIDGRGGSSLRMWRTYFRKARICGIDIEERDLREPRITTFVAVNPIRSSSAG